METLDNEILVPADTSKLSELRAYLYLLCDENHVPSQTTRRMVLAIDEALSNVIEHGLVQNKEDITLSLDIEDDRIIATIRDHGLPFDPTAVGPQSLNVSSPKERVFPRRGFGLYLIHLIVDEVEYYRTATGENVLVLTKSIE